MKYGWLTSSVYFSVTASGSLQLDVIWKWEEILIAFRRVRKIARSDYKLRHVCPSVRMEQRGSHWTDFDEILYLCFLRKSVEKIQVSLKCDKNNGYFT
jgi:hypothetical protein